MARGGRGRGASGRGLSVALAALCVAPVAAHAVDGTWVGPGRFANTGTNWSSSPAAPDNLAIFTNNGAPTSLQFSGNTSINTLQFNAGAPVYSFIVGTPGMVFDINGAGIVNNAASVPFFDVFNFSDLNFRNASTAGNAMLEGFAGRRDISRSSTRSTAGNADILNHGGRARVPRQQHGRQREHQEAAIALAFFDNSYRRQCGADEWHGVEHVF